MALVRFDQDPEMPDGTGLFHADDGSSMYAHDPGMAMQLSPELQAAAEPPPDERMAQNEFASYQPEMVSSSSQSIPSPQRADVAPPMAPAPQPAPAAPAQAEQVDADRLQKNIDDYAMRPVVSGPTRGGVVPLKQDVTRETSGPPYDPNGPQATARADAHIDVQLANRAAYASQAARAQGEAAAWQAAMPELQQKAAIAQKRMDTQKRIYKQERAELDDMVAESQASQKSFNANRWFDDRGAVGTIGAGIAQAFGAYSAALVGGDNQIAKQINSYVDRDIANQRAQIESGKAGVDNQLKRLQLKYGDMDQAEAALKIATQKVVDNQIQMYAASTKNADLIAAGDKWLAENQQRYVLAEQAFENASYGKTSVKTDAKVVAPSAGGARAPTEKEVQERYDTLGKRGKVVEGTYDSEIKRTEALGGGKKADKKADKLSDEAAAYGKAIESAKLNEYTASIANVEEKLRDYAGSADIPGAGTENILSRANRKWDDAIMGEGEFDKRAYSPEERNNRQAIQFMKADIRHAITGAGMSDKERTDLDSMIEQARSGDDFRNVVKIVKTRVAAHKAELARGFSPEAVQLYDSRGTAKPMPLRTVR